jgi:hypothetical protein
MGKELIEYIQQMKASLEKERLMTERGWAIIATSAFDEQLTQLIDVSLVDRKPEIKKEALNEAGPFGTFMAKIDVAFPTGSTP